MERNNQKSTRETIKNFIYGGLVAANSLFVGLDNSSYGDIPYQTKPAITHYNNVQTPCLSDKTSPFTEDANLRKNKDSLEGTIIRYESPESKEFERRIAKEVEGWVVIGGMLSLLLFPLVFDFLPSDFYYE